MIDGFGFVDVAADAWEDSLHYDAASDTVAGCTVNSLLRGMFWLHCGEDSHLPICLPGHAAAWKKVAAFVFPCVTSLLTPDCLLARVALVIQQHLDSLRTGVWRSSEGRSQMDETASRDFAVGAVLFLHTLVLRHSDYISDAHVSKMADAAPAILGPLMAKIQHAGAGNLLHLLDALQTVVRATALLSELRVRKKCPVYRPGGLGWTALNLPTIVHRLPDRVYIDTSYASERSAEPAGSGAPGTGPISVFGVSSELWDDIAREAVPPKAAVHKKGVSFSKDLEAEPTPSPLLRKQSSMTAPIGVFGVSTDLWDDVQSGRATFEEVEEIAELRPSLKSSLGKKPKAPGDSSPVKKNQELEIPRPRITMAGLYDVLEAVAKGALDEGDVLLRQDVLELARQWTLVDASLFHAIPMSSYQICELQCKDQHLQLECGGAARSHTRGIAEWTLPRAEGGAPELRLFIDRFNAQSSWATRQVLRGETARERACSYEKLVHLATCLLELNNFNGCMAITAGLLQGAVTRLTETLSMTSSEVERKFNILKALMAGSKNYSFYRSEVNKVERKASAMDSFLREHDYQFEGLDGGAMRLVPHKPIRHHSSSSVDLDEVRALLEIGSTGIVPHLGPVLSELVLAQEASAVYLLDYPHLLNMDRLAVYGHTLARFRAVAALQYWPLTPVAPMMSAISATVNAELLLVAHEVAERSRALYKLSLSREKGDKPKPIEIADNDNAMVLPHNLHAGDSTVAAVAQSVTAESLPASPMPAVKAASAQAMSTPSPDRISDVDEAQLSPLTPMSTSSTSTKKTKWSLFGGRNKDKGKDSLSPQSPARRGSTVYYNTTEEEAAADRARMLRDNPGCTDTTREREAAVTFGGDKDPFSISSSDMKTPSRQQGAMFGGMRSSSILNVYQGPQSVISGSPHVSGAKDSTNKLSITESASNEHSGLHALPSQSYFHSNSNEHPTTPLSENSSESPIPVSDNMVPQPSVPDFRPDASPIKSSESPLLRSSHSKSYNDWLSRIDHAPSPAHKHFASPGAKSPPFADHSNRLQGSPPPFTFPRHSHHSDTILRGNRSRLLEEYSNHLHSVPKVGIKLLPDTFAQSSPERPLNFVHSTSEDARAEVKKRNNLIRPEEPRNERTMHTSNIGTNYASTKTIAFSNPASVALPPQLAVNAHSESSNNPKKGRRELYDVL